MRVVTPEGVFADAKTSPTTNLARPPSLTSALEGNNPQVDPSTLPLTPLHSTALHLSSLPLQTAHLRYLHSLSTSFPAFTSSVRLLQTWAIRRGYAASLGLSTDWWAWCVARSLNAGGKIAGGDSASLAAGGEGWAGWRKAIEWLSTANWTEGVWLKSSEEKVGRRSFRTGFCPALTPAWRSQYTKADFKRAFAGRPIFVDPTGSVNLAAGIELSTLEMVSQYAGVSPPLRTAHLSRNHAVEIRCAGGDLGAPRQH